MKRPSWTKNIPERGVLCWFERKIGSGDFNEIKRVLRWKEESNQGLAETDEIDSINNKYDCWFHERFIPLTDMEIQQFIGVQS